MLFCRKKPASGNNKSVLYAVKRRKKWKKS